MKPRLTATASLLAFLGTLFGGADGYVVCFGADGHVALEAPEGGRCAETREHGLREPHTRPAGLAAQSDHCGPCEDVPLLAFFNPDSSPLKGKLHGQPAEPARTSVPLPPEYRPPGAHVDRSGRSSPAARSLRTVVLLL